MSGVTGRQAKIAFAKFGTNSWGVPASVTNGIYFSDDGSLTLDPNIIEDDAFGQTFIGTAEVGNIKPPTLSLKAVSRFGDYSYIWEALAMGSPSAPTIVTSAAGQNTSWQHQFDMAPTLDGLGLTYALDRVQYVEELTSANVHGWDLADGTGGIMEETFKITGSKPTIISSTNTNSTVAGAVFPSLGNRVMMKHGIFRMNANAAGALGATDAVHCEKIAFAYDRPQDAPNIYGQDFVDAPADNGFPTATLQITYPRMNTVSANSLYAGLRDSTAYKADWIFTGALINSTDAYQVKYQYPYLQLTSFKTPLAGANQVKPVGMFTARLAPTSPTGMAFVNPFRVTRIMANSAAAF